MAPPMTFRQIDAFCSKLPAATRTVQWEGVIVFKVGGKMFCLIAPPEHSVARSIRNDNSSSPRSTSNCTPDQFPSTRRR